MSEGLDLFMQITGIGKPGDGTHLIHNEHGPATLDLEVFARESTMLAVSVLGDEDDYVAILEAVDPPVRPIMSSAVLRIVMDHILRVADESEVPRLMERMGTFVAGYKRIERG